VVSPGAGWGKPPAANFTIDASGNMSPSAANLSTYMYGTQCKAAEKNPPVFTVTFSVPSQFIVRTGNDISAFCNAQRVQIILDGTEALNSPVVANTNYSINVPAGTHTIKVDNAGGDWYTVSGYTFTNMGSPLNTYLLKSADSKRATGWIHNKKYNWVDAGPGKPAPATISGASLNINGLVNGTYEIKWYECTNGTVQSTTSAIVAGGTLALSIPDVAWDLAFTATEVSVLPVKLSAFSGVYEKQLNRLFITISEAKNVKEIHIERSNDGRDFESIGKLLPQNSQFAGNHQYVDEWRVPGKNYYRLSIADYDGSRQFSKIVVLEPGGSENSIKVYPNPAKDQFTIKGLLDNPADKLQATVTDINGRQIWSQTINTINRSVHEVIYLEKLPVGFYFLGITGMDGKNVFTGKIIKQ